MSVVLFWWMHLASGHRCVLSLVIKYGTEYIAYQQGRSLKTICHFVIKNHGHKRVNMSHARFRHFPLTCLLNQTE